MATRLARELVKSFAEIKVCYMYCIPLIYQMRGLISLKRERERRVKEMSIAWLVSKKPMLSVGVDGIPFWRVTGGLLKALDVSEDVLWTLSWVKRMDQ